MLHPEHNLTLYGAQREVWDAMLSDKNCVLVLPIGSGKSFLSSWVLPIAATTPHMHKGRDILYVAPTAPMVNRIIWKDLKERCIQLWGLEDEKDINNSTKTITFPNGIRIFCLSAETGLKGINASLIIADEAAEFNQEALQELSNRTRPIPGQEDSAGRMIFISTPEGKNAFFDLYEYAIKNSERWCVIHKTWDTMRVQPRSWIEEQRKILSSLKFAKDLECNWGSVEDQFFYAFDIHKHTGDIQDHQGDLYSLHDFNKRRMCAIIVQVKNAYDPTGTMEVLKSYAIEDCSTQGIAEQIRRDFPRRRINSIIDMSGTQVNRDTTSPFGITDRVLLEQYGFTIINNKNSNPLIADTDNSVNAFIRRGGLRVNPNDQLLLDALTTYHFEDGTRKKLVKYTEQKYAHIDGLGDCLRYGIHHLFPLQHAASPIKEYVGMDARFSRMNQPGVEHMPQSPLFPGGPTMDEILTGEEETDYQTWT